MNKGTSKLSRKKEALDAAYISIDERSLLDMMQLTLDFSEDINFHDLQQGIVEKGWRSFFLCDSAFIIAEIANTDMVKFQSDIGEYQKKNELMKNYVSDQIERLQRSNYQGTLILEMKMLLKSIEESEQIFKGNSDEKARLLHKNIFGKIVFIKEKAANKFDEEILESRNHFPQVGLLLAFFKLFKYVQKDINSLVKKHLDYYYRELLRQRPNDLEPHTALVALKLLPGADDIVVEKGGNFHFTIEGGLEKVFQADTSTQINSAIIANIKTLYKSEYLLYGKTALGDDFKFNLAYETQILEDGANYINSIEQDNADLPPVCGEGFLSKWDSQRTVNLCELGFMVSSPSLMLEKGDQSFTLLFNITQSSYSEASNVFEDWQQEEGNVKNISTGGNQKHKFTDIIRDAFQLYITTSEGWKQIEPIKSKFVTLRPTLMLSFNLSDSHENLIPMDNSIHGGNFESDWPCIKILLNNHAIIHPYKFLEKLIVESIVIKASSHGVRNLKLSNSIGELDSSIPFAPFGPMPIPGSYLRIENPLILQRNLTKLVVKLDWNGLPQDPNGFKDYYNEYPNEIDNGSFRAVIGQSRNIDYRDENLGEASFELFDTEKHGNRLSSRKIKEVMLEKMVFNNQIDPAKEMWEDNDTSPLYLILTHPDMSFGHRIFSDIYSETVLKQSRFRRRSLPLPKQPYTPVLAQISVDYVNMAKEIMTRKRDNKESDIKFTHLYPFGHVQLFPAPIKSPCFLIPQIDNKASLYLGLKHVKFTDTVSIGFDLDPAIFAHTILKKPAIVWEYLAYNEWVPFNGAILEESTEGLIKSGIVKLRIPKTLQFDNTRFPKGHFWIRAGTKDPEDLTSKIKSIFSQAVSVTSIKTDFEALGQLKAPYIVNKINYEDEKGIAQIIGPFNLKANEIIEEEALFNTRVSERLRHKKRAVSHWDFERLILEKYDQVQKVRVYGRSSYPDELVKGCSVQVVVIPTNDTISKQQWRRKDLPYSTLEEIKKYLKRFVSPYVKIEVSNPVYELLKIRCYIKVKDFAQSGHLHHELNEALIDFLSPNIEDAKREKGFETAISKAEILNFIEKRPYVKEVISLSVFQIVEVDGAYKIIDSEMRLDSAITMESGTNHSLDRLRTISPYAILTSAPSHYIKIVRSDEIAPPEFAYIDDVAIGSDFIISNDAGNYN